MTVLESSAPAGPGNPCIVGRAVVGCLPGRYCTVFVSVHEGFGLPVAESLASRPRSSLRFSEGMLEIGRLGGSLLVDPLNDFEIVEALRRILQEPQLRDRLSAEAAKLEWRSWDDYATTNPGDSL